MIRKFSLGVSLLLSLTLNARDIINLNRNWEFHNGDSLWKTIDVPHDFMIHQQWVEPSPDELPDLDNPVANIKSRLSARGFKEMGQGWYKKNIVAPTDWKGKRVLLDFEGILLVGDVYLNGIRIGGTDYGYLGFDIDISNLLRYGEDNIITVKADTGLPEHSRWYTGAGIYRDVNIILTDSDLFFPRHPLYITTPNVTKDKASVMIQAEIANYNEAKPQFEITYRIIDPKGNEITTKKVSLKTPKRQQQRSYVVDSLTIENPLLWDCDTPNLYKLEVSLGDSADFVTENFGIRKIEYTAEQGFLLNDKKILLKGIANHHTLGALGAAAYPRAIEKRIKLLKEFGFNHIRSSHNPYSKSFLEICDREGILVVDELYDKWLTQYAGGRKTWEESWVSDLPEWVKRDRNHPCIIMWSLGNELQIIHDIPYNDWGVTPYKMQKALLDRFDSTRPVTVAMHPRGRNHATDSIPADLVFETDIASYNYRYMYFPGDAKRYPWMKFYQSEASTAAMGLNYYGMDLDKVIGLAYWGAIDYLGESQGWPVKGWDKGAFDISLNPKPKAYLLKSMFIEDEPVIHLGIIESDDNTMWNGVKVGNQSLVDHWNFKDNSNLKLYTFTNAEEVELFVNGKSIGRKSNEFNDPKSRNQILWDNIPYKKGKIEAVAYSKGKEVGRHCIKTSSGAVKLKAKFDNPKWKKDGIDLQHVDISAIDSKGILDPYAFDQLTFDVTGPAEIVGVINGDLKSDELTVGNMRSLDNGRAVVILRSKPGDGDIVLNVNSEKYPKLKVKF